MSIPKRQMHRARGHARRVASDAPLPFSNTVARIVTNTNKCIRSIHLEFAPRTTHQYARAVHAATNMPIHIHIRHEQLFITDGWRIRRECLTDEELVQIQNNSAFTSTEHIDRSRLRNQLILRLAPAAREAVRALLLCPAVLS